MLQKMPWLQTWSFLLIFILRWASGSDDVPSPNTDNTAGSGPLIRTTSLSTCMPNSQFQSSFFDVKFYPDKNLIDFNIDATTTISETVVARIELIAYGLSVLQKTVPLCDLGQPMLCPMKPGRINVRSTHPVGKEITKDIPSVAYKIPDLDAQVRVLVYPANDTNLDNPLACVLAVLTNEKTVQTKYASWPIAAISGVGVLTSGFVSVIGHSSTAAHIASNSISLFVYFQNLAITSMMGVSKVPPIAAAWVQNFQWSMGIIKVDFIQDLLKWYVAATGGTPVQVVSNKQILSVSVQKRSLTEKTLVDGAGYVFNRMKQFLTTAQRKAAISIASNQNFDFHFNDTQLYTIDQRNSTNLINKILVLHGIQRVAFKADVELSNFFLTGITFFLFFVVVVVFTLIFFKILVEIMTRARVMKETAKFVEYRRSWGNVLKGTLFRIAIIAFPQLTTLSIWEITQRDSPAVLIDALVILCVLLVVLLYGTIKVIKRGRESSRLYKTPAYLLYGDANFLNRFGFLYVQFKANLYWWLIPLLTYSFLRSLFVAVLQNSGKVQAIVIFSIELVYFITLCSLRPYLDKRTNIFNIVIHFVNLLNATFFLFFSDVFRQPPIVSSVMAIVLFFMNSAFALFLLLFTIITCVVALVHRNPDARYQPMKDDRVSFLPKLNGVSQSEKELANLGKTVMVTNETEDQQRYRNSLVHQNTNQGRRTLLDYEADTEIPLAHQRDAINPSAPSAFASRRSPSLEPQPVQPQSTVLGPGQAYQRVPSHSNSVMDFGDQEYKNQGYTNQGYTNQGYTNQGYTNQGYTNQGYTNQGYTNQGHTDQGYSNEGSNNRQANTYNDPAGYRPYV